MGDATCNAIHRTPDEFLSEVDAFRRAVADERRAFALVSRAWHDVVLHASQLDPHDAKFAAAGIALKEALCLWLDISAARGRPQRSGKVAQE